MVEGRLIRTVWYSLYHQDASVEAKSLINFKDNKPI